MKAQADVWRSERLAAYARAAARLDETLESPETADEADIWLHKLYALSGCPLGSATAAISVWREFGGWGTVN